MNPIQLNIILVLIVDNVKQLLSNSKTYAHQIILVVNILKHETLVVNKVWNIKVFNIFILKHPQ